MSTPDLLDPMSEYEVSTTAAPDPEGVEGAAESWPDPLGPPGFDIVPTHGWRQNLPAGLRPGRGGAARIDPHTSQNGEENTSLDATVASLPMPLVELVDRALAAVADALAEPPLDEDLWGARPDDAAAIHAAIDAAVADWQAADALRRAALSRREAAERLHESPMSLILRANARSIVAFEHAGEQWFPAWQFDAGIDGDHVARVWKRFPGDAIWFTEWVHQPQSALHGRTAIDALREQDVDAVLAVVDALTA